MTSGVLAVVGLVIAFSLSSTLVKRAESPGVLVAPVLAAGDVPLAFGCIFGLPRALGRSHRQLLTNRSSA